MMVLQLTTDDKRTRYVFWEPRAVTRGWLEGKKFCLQVKSLRRWRVEWDYDVIVITASHDRHRVIIDLDLLSNNSFVDWVVF